VAIVPPIVTFLGAFTAKHTPRPDLVADATAIFEQNKGQLAEWLAKQDPAMAGVIDTVLGVGVSGTHAAAVAGSAPAATPAVQPGTAARPSRPTATRRRQPYSRQTSPRSRSPWPNSRCSV